LEENRLFQRVFHLTQVRQGSDEAAWKHQLFSLTEKEFSAATSEIGNTTLEVWLLCLDMVV